jgi:uncharacterized membrane protein YuzA (DUF378 family)
MNDMETKYWQVKMYHLLLLLVFVGGLNWGTTALGYNLVEMLKNTINNLVGMETYLDKIVYLLVALSVIKLATRRDVWLTFLGESVLPGSLVPLKEVNGDTIVEVKVKPNTRVAYWASLPYEDSKTPLVHEAYGDFKNAGVVMSDKNGVAKLSVIKGTSYIVPSGREIPRHVHYRVLDQVWGMIGPIETKYY